MKIKDPKTGEMREETDDERKAREAAAEGEGDGGGGESGGEDTVESLRKDRDKWKGLAVKHEGNAKKNADKAKKWDGHEAETATVAEKSAATEARAAAAERERDRLKVGMRKGLTESQAKRLQGDTEEEMEKDADELVATFKPAKGAEGEGEGQQQQRGTPKERLVSGTQRGQEPEKDPAKIAEQVMNTRRY